MFLNNKINIDLNKLNITNNNNMTNFPMLPKYCKKLTTKYFIPFDECFLFIVFFLSNFLTLD